MSKKNLKKEYIILGAIIIVLLIYLVSKSGDKIHYKLPELAKLDAKTLSKIEITKPDLTLTLVQKDDKWLIDPNGYPTDETKVKDITGTVCELNLTALASKSGNYNRYDLEKEKAITVKAYQQDKVVREFLVGKVTPTNNHTFVKLKDNDYVYHAEKAFRRFFDQKIDDLRDKTAMKFDTNEISEIEVKKEAETFLFAKTVKPVETKPEAAAEKPEAGKEEKKEAAPVQPPTEQTETIWAAADGKEGNKTELDSLLSQLADLKCDEYLDENNKTVLQEPVYTIRLKGKKDYTLTIYKKMEKEGDGGAEKYPVVSSENPYPFLLSSYKADRLMKKQEDLLKK